MKVLVDGDVFAWQKHGGISRIYKEVLPRIARLDFVDKVILVGQGLEVSSLDLHDCCEIVNVTKVQLQRYKPWRFWYWLSNFINRSLLRLAWIRLSRTGDVFVSTYFTDPPVKCPKIVVVYDMIYEVYPDSFESNNWQITVQRKKRAIKNADCLISISESTKKDVCSLLDVDPELCTVVHLAAGLSEGPPADASSREPFVLYIGGCGSGYKNFDFLLENYLEARSSIFSDMQLIAVCPEMPEEDSVARQLLQRNPEADVEFIEDCDDEKLAALYSQCDLFVYPSLYEGFGIPVLEALTFGAPIACSFSSSLPEVGGDAVHYFDPISKDEFLAAAQKALEEGRDKSYVEKRKVHAMGFSWDNTAQGFANVIMSVSAPKPSK
ncbi:hypothetical protein BVX97_00780 [bacterium E08(2017)]|nr:hypothetical protein BVX97_00780 [bacterium E08(2017)]